MALILDEDARTGVKRKESKKIIERTAKLPHGKLSYSIAESRSDTGLFLP
jgi:hypothetical protein